jgi:hypothetical protein
MVHQRGHSTVCAKLDILWLLLCRAIRKLHLNPDPRDWQKKNEDKLYILQVVGHTRCHFRESNFKIQNFELQTIAHY